jgi:N-ethylmaleimide reductase
LLEALDEVIKVIGKGRVGLRLSPFGTFNDMQDSNPIELFSYVLQEISNRKIAFVDLIEPRSSVAGGSDSVNSSAPSTSQLFRKKYDGVLISSGGYDAQSAKEVVEKGEADAVAFGRHYIANPDLAERIKFGYDLNKYNRATFYGGAEKGYTDYPFYNK